MTRAQSDAAADWTKLTMESWSLGMEAGAVMWLRTMRIMAGGAIGERETRRMVDEKLAANMEAATQMWLSPITSAATARNAMAPYRARVKANRKRLGKG